MVLMWQILLSFGQSKPYISSLGHVCQCSYSVACPSHSNCCKQDHKTKYTSCHFHDRTLHCCWGHFYSFANMQQTVFGLVHAFVIDTLVTNTEHLRTRVLLFRMLQYLYKFTVLGANPQSKLLYTSRCQVSWLPVQQKMVLYASQHWLTWPRSQTSSPYATTAYYRTS